MNNVINGNRRRGKNEKRVNSQPDTLSSALSAIIEPVSDLELSRREKRLQDITTKTRLAEQELRLTEEKGKSAMLALNKLTSQNPAVISSAAFVSSFSIPQIPVNIK